MAEADVNRIQSSDRERFSSEADTGSREENASIARIWSFGSDSIRTENAQSVNLDDEDDAPGMTAWNTDLAAESMSSATFRA
jgi:hypothetical protein